VGQLAAGENEVRGRMFPISMPLLDLSTNAGTLLQFMRRCFKIG